MREVWTGIGETKQDVDHEYEADNNRQMKTEIVNFSFNISLQMFFVISSKRTADSFYIRNEQIHNINRRVNGQAFNETGRSGSPLQLKSKDFKFSAFGDAQGPAEFGSEEELTKNALIAWKLMK
ncbi:hypothetical protein T265_11964 [Opisthorchis viverrini]|uniref:Uncharacterized protein n=1 Tax=Opisthorchis viverrini TaxID=6198 RepID=A0A074Z7K2_OPIVI|nr:hypothetical protein T265_11964 [Opisthorchis viverrini]KER19175.1 hypothetical protein T265_11964 [Opisthorchis viverrini]